MARRTVPRDELTTPIVPREPPTVVPDHEPPTTKPEPKPTSCTAVALRLANGEEFLLHDKSCAYTAFGEPICVNVLQIGDLLKTESGASAVKSIASQAETPTCTLSAEPGSGEQVVRGLLVRS